MVIKATSKFEVGATQALSNVFARGWLLVAAVVFLTFAPVDHVTPFKGVGLYGVSEAQAQRRPRSRAEGEGVVRQPVADAYNEALEMMQDGNTAGAIAHIRPLLADATPFEASIIYRFMGQAEIDRENFAAAVGHFESAINSGGLEGNDLAQLYLIVGQLHAADGQYDRAISSLNQYFNVVEEPEAQAYYVLAQVYAVADRIRDAVSPARTAVEMTAAEPREGFIRLLMSLYLSLDEWSNALPLLQQLVGLAPDKDQYWVSLAGVYQQLDREDEAFAVYQFRYLMGFFTRSAEYVTLADLFMYHEVPYKAGQILERELAAGNVEANATNWEKLGNAWFAAREFERSRAALTRAANLSPDGQISYRIAGTHIQEEDWNQARRWLERALNQGGLDDPGQGWLLLGHARNEVNDYEGAVAAFQRAQAYADWREDATTWLTVMENRRLAREAEREHQEAYTAEAADIVETGEHAAQLAEAAAGLAREAYEQARLARQVSDSERPGIMESARASIDEAREADDAARNPDFGTEADVRERVRRIGTSAREDDNTALAVNLEEQSERFLERRITALTESDRLIRQAEEELFEAQQM